MRELFSQYGTVTKVQLIMDRETGRPRGFAFVEMSDGGDQAIQATNGMQIDGRTLTVNEAKPREDRPAAVVAAGTAAAVVAAGTAAAAAAVVMAGVAVVAVVIDSVGSRREALANGAGARSLDRGRLATQFRTRKVMRPLVRS